MLLEIIKMVYQTLGNCFLHVRFWVVLIRKWPTREYTCTILFFFYLYISYLTWVDHSVYNTVFPWFLRWGLQTVRRYPDRNWLRGLCHPLHLPNKSDAVMEQSAMETTFWALLGIEPGPFAPESKTLTTVSRCSSLNTF